MSNRTPIQIGVIGVGFGTKVQIPAFLSEGVGVSAVCAAHEERAEKAADEFGIPQVYTDYKKMIHEADIDAVSIVTPPFLHHEMALEAINAGKHVICEKPLARTVAEAKELADATVEAKGLFMVAMCLRFWPQWAWLKEAVDTDRYGKVQAAHFQRIAEPPAWGQAIYFDGATSGGALFDLHVHDTDFVQHVFGRPKSVYSTGFSKVSGAVDHVLTQYEVECGAKVSAEGSWAMTPGWGFNMSYRAIFERATADYDIGRAAEPLRLFEEGKEKQVIKCEGTDGYAGELAHFIDSIRSGQTPSVSAEDGLCTVEICAAEEQSVKTGQTVKLN